MLCPYRKGPERGARFAARRSGPLAFAGTWQWQMFGGLLYDWKVRQSTIHRVYLRVDP